MKNVPLFVVSGVAIFLMFSLLVMRSQSNSLSFELAHTRSELGICVIEVDTAKQDLDIMKSDQTFERDNNCRAEAMKLRIRWSNIQNGYYDSVSQQCYVSFKDMKTNKIESGPISGMQDA